MVPGGGLLVCMRHEASGEEPEQEATPREHRRQEGNTGSIRRSGASLHLAEPAASVRSVMTGSAFRRSTTAGSFASGDEDGTGRCGIKSVA